jgi:hypothetical protein
VRLGDVLGGGGADVSCGGDGGADVRWGGGGGAEVDAAPDAGVFDLDDGGGEAGEAACRRGQGGGGGEFAVVAVERREDGWRRRCNAGVTGGVSWNAGVVSRGVQPGSGVVCTVKKHLENVYAKLDVTNRTAAVAKTAPR